jgi:hypothetical protein
MDRNAGGRGNCVRKKDQPLIKRLNQGLDSFSRDEHSLPGVGEQAVRDVLVRQMVDSVRRVKFPGVISGQPHSERRKDPADEIFDPIRAAILHYREGNVDEAYWLVFLFVQFGKHGKGGYLYARSVYGRFGEGGRWDWKSTSADPAAFRAWLHANQERLKALPTHFGNHRKRESLDAYSGKGTGATVGTYVSWVAPPRTHQQVFEEAIELAAGDPKKAFDLLYESMAQVRRFGRMARFDYFSMVGKLGFARIEPGSTYLEGASGPVTGAKLLFGGSPTAKMSVAQLDQLLIRLDTHLNVGMQVLEDAVCNWQKSPGTFKSFRG